MDVTCLLVGPALLPRKRLQEGRLPQATEPVSMNQIFFILPINKSDNKMISFNIC